MLTGKDLILATKPYAKEIPWKSWYYTISTLMVLAALWTGIYFIPNLYGKLACSILLGCVIVRMFVIYHDNMHNAILPKSVLADILFWTFGVFILAPPSIWKRSHDYHHNHNSKLFTASIGSWPIVTKQKFKRLSRGQQISYLAIRHPLTILFGYIIVFFYGLSLQSLIASPKKHWDSLIAIVFHLGLSALVFIYLGWLAWVLMIGIPYLISCAIGSYLFYAQHNFPGVSFKGNIEWSYDNAALESSSYMVMNPFWKWMTANIGYHHIHHMNSRIPFYRLPEVMEKIPEMQAAKTTTLNPSDIIACFKLKVWDPEKNRMIGLSEI